MNKLPACIKLTRNAISYSTIARKSIDWKLGMTTAEQTQTVSANTDVIFKWTGSHDVWLLPNKGAYDACEFSQGKELASTSVNKYTYETLAAGTFYFACKVTGHCRFDVKLALTVTPPPLSPAPTTTPAPGWHFASARVKLVRH